MPLALWTLLWLNFRAVIRRTGRQMRSVRGILFFLIGLGVLGIYIVPSIFPNSRVRPADPGPALATAPVVILALSMLNLLAAAGERAVTFTPAEVDFLFPGPFSRRQLLIYKLLKTGLAGIFSAMILGAVLGRLGGSFFSRTVGVWVLFQFLQLLAMAIALLQASIGERAVTAGRRWALAAVGAAIALAVLEVVHTHHELTPAVLMEARDTKAGQIVLAPFKVFAHALLARRFFFDGLRWMAMAAGIDVALATVVIGLDANYLETSATVSARRYDRLARVRRSGVAGMAKASSSRWKIAMLPWLGGAGPIIWRQLTTALRTIRTLLTILFVLAIGGGALISRHGGQSGSIGFIIGMSIYLNLFVSQLLKFDFRGDLDHLDVLRSLPLRASAVAAGQLVAPTLVLSVVQMLLLATLAIAGHFPVLYVIALAIFLVPLNLLALGTDNLTFLLFPFRPKAAVAGDMALVGRQTILFACRFMLILIVGGIAAGFGVCSWMLTSHSWAAAAIAAWLPLAGAIVLIVWLMGLVYDRFDPSVSTPT